MPDVAQDSFSHFHHDALRELKLLRATTVPYPADGPIQSAHEALRMMYESTLDGVIEQVANATLADAALRGSLMALKKVDDLRYLLLNLLEVVKRGDSLQDGLKRLHEAGLVDGAAGEKISTFPLTEKRQSPWPSTLRAGRFVRALLSKLTDAALSLMELATNAIKAIPKFASLRVKPNIGWTGFFPTFTLQVDLQAEAVSLYDFFELLKGEG